MIEAILSLDVGTTAVKAVLFNPAGSELVTAEQGITLHTPRPGWVELDPDELWQAVLEVLREIVQNSIQTHIMAVTLATQGGSFLALDARGDPTCPIITWMDSRSEPVIQRWKAQRLDLDIRRISGWTPEAGLPIAMIAWLRVEQPETFTASAHFISVNDFLTFRLAGILSMNPSMAGEMLLTDMTTGDWSDVLGEIAGINPQQLSPIRPSAAVIGHLLPEVSRQIGLPEDIPLINGGQDHSCEALAVGLIGTGKALLACGTAWVINGATHQAEIASIPAGMNLNYHVIPACWTVSQFLGGLGGAVEWWLNHTWQNANPEVSIPRAELYALFDRALMQTYPGGGGLYFFPLSGTRQLAVSQTGGGFLGLRLDHTRGDMSRAILECAACEVRWSLERLGSAGLPIEQLFMLGGATRSTLWPSIVAALTGIPVYIPRVSHGPALGAAILAGVGLGIYPDVDYGRALYNLQSNEVMPDAAWHSTYEGYYNRYRELTGKLVDL
jgi:xylulokinase